MDKQQMTDISSQNQDVEASDDASLIEPYQELGRFTDVSMLAADWFWEMDASLRFTYQSQRFEEITDLKISDVVGKTREEAFAGLIDDTEKWQRLGADLKNQNKYTMAWALIRPDGSRRILRTQGKPIYDSNQVFQGYRGVGSDITESVEVLAALEASEERLRDFAETAADWFWEQDEQFRYTYLSSNHPSFDNHQRKHILGKTRQEIYTYQDFHSSQWQEVDSLMEKRLPFRDLEYQIQVSSKNFIVVRINGKPMFDSEGVFKGYRGTGIDITEAHKLSKQISYQASHDSLTDLINRREFENRLKEALKSSHRDNSEHALCYIDLDQFKVVNDTCGHEGGDELLLQITSILQNQVRKDDTVARLGGDEFGLLLENCPLEQASIIAEKVRHSVEEFRFVKDGRTFKIGTSIGMVPINEHSGDLSEVMREADAACYEAKDAGRNRVHIYHVDNIDVAKRHEEMERIVEINHAFDEKRFVLYRQSIQDLQNHSEPGKHLYEVLVRMIDTENNIVLPELFLPVAERYNLITQLDSWVVKTTIDLLCREQSENKDTHCTINLSGMSVASDRFLSFVLEALDLSGVEASRICFEITETAAIENMESAIHFINELKARGCFFALDDFGSGFSSFAYLKTFPVDYLKIDGFFVRDMLKDSVNYEMVKSINDIGHVMGKKTMAEFVEDKKTMDALREIGVDYAQGFAIDRPCPVEA